MGSTGRYRVYPGPDDDALRLLDRERFEVTTVPTGDDDTVADLNPGYLIEATLDTSGVEPHLRDASVVRPTLYDFADGAEPMFEVAEDLWADAQMAGEGMASGVTKNTDNEVNGACYVFAEDALGGRFEEFYRGERPLEPLVDRFNQTEGPAPRETFVLRPPDQGFLVVVIAREKGGQFAETVRETYDLPAPGEPLV